jgi:hypothetical protein
MLADLESILQYLRPSLEGGTPSSGVSRPAQRAQAAAVPRRQKGAGERETHLNRHRRRALVCDDDAANGQGGLCTASDPASSRGDAARRPRVAAQI